MDNGFVTNVFFQSPKEDSEKLEYRRKNGIQSPFTPWLQANTTNMETEKNINAYIRSLKIAPYTALFQEHQLTLIMALFFTVDNVQLLQDNIITIVRKRTGKQIGPQSERDLIQLMFETYLANACQIDESSTDWDYLLNYSKKLLKTLNYIALNRCVSIVIKNMEEYFTYQTQKLNTRVSDLPMPISSSVFGTLEQRDSIFQTR